MRPDYTDMPASLANYGNKLVFLFDPIRLMKEKRRLGLFPLVINFNCKGQLVEIACCPRHWCSSNIIYSQ